MKQKMLIGICVVFLILMVFAYRISSSGNEMITETVKVHYGDTLYGYAEKYAPNMDKRIYVDEVLKLNHMSHADIYVGDEILVLKEVGR
jgi:hypothetical protein